MNKVLELIRKKPGMTGREIAEALYGKHAPQQRVNPDCRMLVSLGLVERGGVGGPGDPYVYRATKKAIAD